jgi:hypothetical protein
MKLELLWFFFVVWPCERSHWLSGLLPLRVSLSFFIDLTGWVDESVSTIYAAFSENGSQRSSIGASKLIMENN